MRAGAPDTTPGSGAPRSHCEIFRKKLGIRVVTMSGLCVQMERGNFVTEVSECFNVFALVCARKQTRWFGRLALEERERENDL